MVITTEQIKELRDRTGISIAQCKKALEDAGGDINKAIELLKEKGAEVAEKKATRELHAGLVSAYVHANGKLGALVQIHVETDFVAKNEGFKTLADDIAMQVVAMNPTDVTELLAQPFIKDPTLTVDDLVKNHVQKFGERIEIAKFARLDTNN
ncbi:MAG: translation elongation factor Ts [Candidatus Vogelbacteria bacterium]|nr:translation elongation factor Ts [Candidatus Vogelbacteria bacterium]